MSTVRSLREQYSHATRSALLDAATRRFAGKGFAGTALADVARDIQATRGAVYHHFASKSALFEAVFAQLETAVIDRCAAAATAASGPWEAAFAALDAFLDGCCDPVYGKVVWQEAPLALGWHRWREAEEKYSYGLIEQLIAALMDSGEVTRRPLEPVTRVVFGILGAAGLALAEAADEAKAGVREEYAAVIGRMISGLRR